MASPKAAFNQQTKKHGEPADRLDPSPRRRSRRVVTPTVLQMEAAECGAACLSMILGYYGRKEPLEKLRVECGVSRDGSKASNILKAARRYNLEPKGFRKQPEDLLEFDMPVIIFWNFNHFVVLEGFRKGQAFLNDPAMGRRSVTWEEFDQSFTGIVLTFQPEEGFERGGSQSGLLHLLRSRLAGAQTGMLYVGLVSIALVIPGLIVPSFTRMFVDDVLLASRTHWLQPLLIGMGLTALLKGGLTWIQQYTLTRLEARISLSNASRFFWHLLRLPVEFFAHRHGGEVASRVQLNQKIAMLLSGDLATAVFNLVTMLFFLLVMADYSGTLTLIGVAAAAINLLLLKHFAGARVDQYMRVLKDQGNLLSTTMVGLQSIETLKATGSEGDFFAKWAGSHAKLVNSEQTVGTWSTIVGSLPSLLMHMCVAAVLIVGAYEVLDGQLSVGELVAFQGLLLGFLGPANQLVNLGAKVQEVRGDMARVDDILNCEVEDFVADEPDAALDAAELTTLEGRVELRDITFGYVKLGPPLIEGFSLSVKPGQRVALVGGSGSGKSTIAKLIAGLYEPWSGGILFDGRSRREIARSVLTNALSMVDQDIHLFEGTVAENITLWDDTIPRQAVVNAAKDADLHEVISSRKGGYDGIIQEGGRNLSGGQRQRLEIARALVGEPAIIILDEATSALDPVSEKLIDDNLRRRGCTCIIVAHRLSTIRDCDEIIVMDKGKVVQRGDHESLQREDGLYARLIHAE